MVGREMLKTLEQRNFPLSKIIPLSSPRSAGSKVTYCGEDIVTVQAVAEDSFSNEHCVVSAGGSTSKTWAPIAAKSGAVVIDNSSAWRMNDDVPLVIPEINPEDALMHKGIIANPNCSTIQALMAIWPLHREAGLLYMNISTYQSVAGTGIKALNTLKMRPWQLKREKRSLKVASTRIK